MFVVNETTGEVSTAEPAAQTGAGLGASTWVRGTIIGILFMTGLIALFFGYNGFQSFASLIGFGTSNEVAPSSLGGVLYLSAITADPETGAVTDAVPFLLDSESRTAAYIPFDQLVAGRALALQYAASDDASGVVFLGTPINASSSVSQKVPSVYYADLRGTNTFDQAVASMQRAQVVATPTTEDYFREFPVVSVGQKIAYASLGEDVFEQAKESLSDLQANDWSIVVLDGLGGARTIAQGVHPKWVGKDTLTYLKNDGVYAQDIPTGEEWQVVPLDFIPNIASGFDVANNGGFLVITNPESAQVIVLRVLDWRSALVSAYAHMRKSATGPIFSPDGSHIAMLSVGKDGQTEVVFYSMDTKSFMQETISFDSESISGLYLTDWR